MTTGHHTSLGGQTVPWQTVISTLIWSNHPTPTHIPECRSQILAHKETSPHPKAASLRPTWDPQQSRVLTVPPPRGLYPSSSLLVFAPQVTDSPTAVHTAPHSPLRRAGRAVDDLHAPPAG